MKKKIAELKVQTKEGIRGGRGRATALDYLAPGEMDGVLSAGRIVLEPGASIGEHPHPETEELYLILEGHGIGYLDDEEFEVGPGDVWVCKAGHTHGLQNGTSGPLAFFAVLTSKADAR